MTLKTKRCLPCLLTLTIVITFLAVVIGGQPILFYTF